MKWLGNQRRVYLLAVVLLVLTILLCSTWNLWRKPAAPAEPAGSPTALPSATGGSGPLEPTPLPTQSADAVDLTGETRNTVVYYQDNNGYLVPVMRAVPAEEGIAKATLNMMVQNPYNDMEAARLGLRTVMPEGTEIDLDISDQGVARIDLSKQVYQLPDAEAESNMVSAVVQTLTEFPTVDTVRFLVDGQQVEKLTHGTGISGDFQRGSVNLESASSELSPSEAQKVQLYFPGENGSLIVPVTRMVFGNADINTAVLELAKGPSAASPLDSVLPSGCGLIGVTVNDGVATINFTQEFMSLAEENDGGRQAMKALMLTATQFPGIKKVEIQVEGTPYDPGQSTLSVPTFINEAGSIADQFLQTQSAKVFELE